MTTAHSTLTGTDLHELKGASTATAGQVPIADGAGSSPFGKLTATSLTGTGNPFGAQLLHIREEQASGVNSTNVNTSGSYVTTVLNTVKTNEISGASLATNQITLPAGTYYVEASVPWYINTTGSNTKFQARLFNSTAAAAIIYGSGIILGGSSTTTQASSRVCGRFTLAVPSVVLLQHQKSAPYLSGPLSYGLEVYAEIMIWKVL